MKLELYIFPLLRKKMYLYNAYQCKISCIVMYLKKAGLANRNVVHRLNSSLRCIGLCF